MLEFLYKIFNWVILDDNSNMKDCNLGNHSPPATHDNSKYVQPHRDQLGGHNCIQTNWNSSCCIISKVIYFASLLYLKEVIIGMNTHEVIYGFNDKGRTKLNRIYLQWQPVLNQAAWTTLSLKLDKGWFKNLTKWNFVFVIPRGDSITQVNKKQEINFLTPSPETTM